MMPRRALPLLGVGLLWLFLALFLVYPLLRIFYDAITDEVGRLTLANFVAFFTDAFYLRALWKSLALGVATVAASSVVGIAVAFLLVRFDFPGRSLFGYLTMIPIISPPLVGTLGFTFILGRAGSINVLLQDVFDLLRPINFLYGLHGVVLVETLHLFPMITLNVVDALGKIDPSLEEAAESVGARGWRKFWTVTLPLMTPGYVAGALLVFIWTFSDFLMVARRWVGLKDYASLSYAVVERRRLTPWKRAGAVGFLSTLMLLSFIPYAGVALASFSKGWSLTPLPLSYTLQHYERVIVETPKYILNSFLYSGLAVALCIAVGVPIAWVLARSRLPGRGALDSINTLILAVPGTAIGIAYIRAFHFDLPGFDRGLTSFWIVMPIVLAVRRLPYTVRAAHSSLLLVHRSMEEAAQSVGATGLRTIRDISLPLIWKGIVVGSLFSFMTSLQEASAVLFLALGGWEMITNGIFTFYIAGSSSEAAALGVILIAVAALSVLVINRLAAGRMGGVFG